MEKENPYLQLAHYILPEEIESSFELVDVKEEVAPATRKSSRLF
jgi:hypothetical protein